MSNPTSAESLQVVDNLIEELERTVKKREAELRKEAAERIEAEVRQGLKEPLDDLAAAKRVASRLRSAFGQESPKSGEAAGREGSGARRRRPATTKRKPSSDEHKAQTPPHTRGKQEDASWTLVAEQVSYDEVSVADVLEIVEKLHLDHSKKQVEKKLFNWKKAGIMRSTVRGRFRFTAKGRSRYALLAPETDNVHHLHRAGGGG